MGETLQQTPNVYIQLVKAKKSESESKILSGCE